MSYAGERGTYTAYRTTTSAPGVPRESFGPYIGYRASLTSTARYSAGGGGQMIDVTDHVAFSLEENGGPPDIQNHYVLVEAESGEAFVVLDTRDIDGITLVVTLAAQTPPSWHSPVVVP